MFEALLAFFTFALPKAGALIKGVPLTMALVLLALYSFYYLPGMIRLVCDRKVLGVPYLLLLYFIILTGCVNWGAPGFSVRMAEAVLYLISPLTLFAGQRMETKKLVRILWITVFIVGIFALIQYTGGVERTKIPGLTLQWGDNYLSKPLGWGMNGQETQKIPSTYQNGNALGIMTAQLLGIFLYVSARLKKQWQRIVNQLVILLCFIILLLCGSRTAIVSALVVILPLLFGGRIRIHRKRAAELAVTVTVGLLLFIAVDRMMAFGIWDRVYDRYVVNTFVKGGGAAGTAGRTDQWLRFLDGVFSLDHGGAWRFFWTGFSWRHMRMAEGLLYVMGCFGVVAFVCFTVLLIRPIFRAFTLDRLWGLSFLAVFVALCVDRTFCSTPVLMNYFFLDGAVIRLLSERRNDDA